MTYNKQTIIKKQHKKNIPSLHLQNPQSLHNTPIPQYPIVTPCQMLTQRDKINLQKLLQLYNFSQLRPPPQIYQQSIPQQQYFTDLGGGKKKRFIYYRVAYTAEEEKKIAQVKDKMSQFGIFQNYPAEIVLKHLYAVELNVDKALTRLKSLQSFQQNPTITTLSKQTLSKLQSGCIYTYGHDRSFKPIIILRADKFSYSTPIDQNYNPVYFLMLVVLAYRTVPYFAQKYICIFDLCNMNMKDIPYKYLYQVFVCMNLYYCGNVEKTYIYNAKGIGWVWTCVKGFLPQASLKKIMFIDDGNIEEIYKQIDPLELEKRYGGKLDDLTEFWPPKCTNEEFDAIQLLKKREKQEEDVMTNSEFYSVCNDAEFFQEKSEGLCGSGGCGGNCNIF